MTDKNVVDLADIKKKKKEDLEIEFIPEFELPFEYSSEIAIADDFIVYSEKKFSKFQIYMTKLFFGWKIKNYDKPREVSTGTDDSLE